MADDETTLATGEGAAESQPAASTPASAGSPPSQPAYMTRDEVERLRAEDRAESDRRVEQALRKAQSGFDRALAKAQGREAHIREMAADEGWSEQEVQQRVDREYSRVPRYAATEQPQPQPTPPAQQQPNPADWQGQVRDYVRKAGKIAGLSAKDPELQAVLAEAEDLPPMSPDAEEKINTLLRQATRKQDARLAKEAADKQAQADADKVRTATEQFGGLGALGSGGGTPVTNQKLEQELQRMLALDPPSDPVKYQDHYARIDELRRQLKWIQ